MPDNAPWLDIAGMNEDELRQKVILPLLAATPGVSGIQDVHGRNEKGLDVIFFEESSIQPTCYGLQLKKGDISGGGTKEGTVREIIDQLGLAKDLEHPIAIEREPTRVQVHRFVVATFGRISDTARDEIASRVKAVPVVFWDGITIERRIRKYLPELITAGDAAVVAYLKAIIARFDKLDALDQVPGVASRTLTQIYEEPALRRRFDPSIAGDEGVSMPSVSILALGLCEVGGNAVVIADQDGGKTALFRMLGLRLAREVLGGSAQQRRLPVMVRAGGVMSGDLVAAIKAEFSRLSSDSLGLTLEEDLTRGGYVLFVDGFSELLKEDEKARAEALIVQFSAAYPNAKVVVAARPSDFLTPTYFRAFRHYVIQEFNKRQVTSLLNRWTSDSPTLADVARKLVTRVTEALQLPGSPISATIGVMLYEQERRYITNIAEAVDRYMVIRLGRYARELGIKQEIEWTRKLDILAELAFEMVEHGIDGLPESEFVTRCDAVFTRLGEAPKGDVVLLELLESGVVARDGDRIAFHRTAFRDFFAAHAINLRKDREDFFRKSLFDRRWGLALVFAAGLRRKNTELLHQLAADVRTVLEKAVGEPASDYFYGAYLVGRILSNSELSDNDARVDSLRTSLKGIVASAPGFVAEARSQFGNIGEVAAIIGLEHTFFVTVGVPWLEKQLLALLDEASISEDERYLLASTYAHLGCRDCIGTLASAASRIQSTQVLLALNVLGKHLLAERNLSKADRAELKALVARIEHRLAKPKRKKEVKLLLDIKSKVIAMEVLRMRRLASAQEKKGEH